MISVGSPRCAAVEPVNPALTVRWSELLVSAVSEPGKIHEAYSRFHGYSIGNQMLALAQCAGRGIEPGPIGTFMHWKDAGRYVRKGEKAIMLCMPVTSKKRETTTDETGAEVETESVFTRFIYRNNWFVLSQTEGDAYQAPTTPNWDRSRALAELDITEVPFNELDGNIQGYAQGRKVSVSPVAGLPEKTRFHELAHVVLGHTAESAQTDSEHTPRNIREVEAECVALLCCASLQLPGPESSRAYIQGWLHGETISEKSAHRIFHAADLILRAGKEVRS